MEGETESESLDRQRRGGREAALALARGLRLIVNAVMVAKKYLATYHWMFDDERGRRVLDYWPTNGTWRAPHSGRKGKAKDPYEALEVASKVGGEMGP